MPIGYFSKKLQRQLQRGKSGGLYHPKCNGFYWLTPTGEKVLVTHVLAAGDCIGARMSERVGEVVTPLGRAQAGEYYKMNKDNELERME